MLLSAKTYTYIWSIGLSYDMFNPEGHHFPYFMATLLPFYGFFWAWKQLETLMARYGNFGPKMVTFGASWGPPGPFSWRQKGPKWSSWMWNTMFNHVQPMFNPFEAAEAAQGQIWPFWVKRGHKMAIKYGLWWPSRLKKCPSTFYYPNWTQRHLIEHSLSEN